MGVPCKDEMNIKKPSIMSAKHIEGSLIMETMRILILGYLSSCIVTKPYLKCQDKNPVSEKE